MRQTIAKPTDLGKKTKQKVAAEGDKSNKEINKMMEKAIFQEGGQ